MSGASLTLHITQSTPPYCQAWWWQHHVIRLPFISRDWQACHDRRDNGWYKVQENPWWKPLWVSHESDWVWDSHFSSTMIQSTKLKPHESGWIRNKEINVLELSNQSPDLNWIEHLWWDFKIAVHWRSPSNLPELEQFLREEWAKISPSHCAKLVEIYPKRLVTVIAGKSASTKYWPKGLNTFTTSEFWFVYVFLQVFLTCNLLQL